MAAPVVVNDRVAIAGAGARRGIAVPRGLPLWTTRCSISTLALAQHYHTLRIGRRLPREHDARAVHEDGDAEDVRRPGDLRVPPSLGRRRAGSRSRTSMLHSCGRSAAARFVACGFGGRSARVYQLPDAAAVRRPTSSVLPAASASPCSRGTSPRLRRPRRSRPRAQRIRGQRLRRPISGSDANSAAGCAGAGAAARGRGTLGRSRGSGSSSRARRASSGSTSASSGLMRPRSASPTGTPRAEARLRAPRLERVWARVHRHSLTGPPACETR